MRLLGLAFGFLTTLPVRARGEFQPGDTGRAAVWYPLVGVVIGGLVALARWGLGLVLPPLLTAGLCLALWVLLSGGLHLDGLADCCDGMLNASTPERRLEIMKDPRLGTFGGVGLILVLLLKLLALVSLPPGLPGALGILLAASLGRWMLLPAGLMPAARPGGLGADFASGLRPVAFIGAAVIPLALAALGGGAGLAAAALAHLAALGVLRLAKARIGGVTGDVFGALVEVTEVVVLISLQLTVYS